MTSMKIFESIWSSLCQVHSHYPASSCKSKHLDVHLRGIRLELHPDNGIPSVPLSK